MSSRAWSLPLTVSLCNFSGTWISRKPWMNGMYFKHCFGTFQPNLVDLCWCWVSHLECLYFIWLNWALCALMSPEAFSSFFKTFGLYRPSWCAYTPWLGRQPWRRRLAECRLWWILGPLTVKKWRRNMSGWILHGNTWCSTSAKVRQGFICKECEFAYSKFQRCVTTLARSFLQLPHKWQFKAASKRSMQTWALLQHYYHTFVRNTRWCPIFPCRANIPTWLYNS